MKPTVTRWYRCSIKPVRAGWYEARWYGEKMDGCRRYWNGRQWTAGGNFWTTFGLYFGDEWRGLTSEAA